MANNDRYLNLNGLSYFINKLKTVFQDKLVSGNNIKTVNNQSLLGSGNIDIQSGGSVDDVTVDGTSIVTNGIAAMAMLTEEDIEEIVGETIDNYESESF